MIDLGTVRPGSTIRIPFSSFDKDDGSSITMTNYAVGDILIYKDGNTTERASTNGFTATTDFDSKTGKHLAVIDLADNSTAGFFAAGSEYLVAIDAVTVDTVTTGGWIARFRIGYVGAILDTTISSLGTSTNQMVFALTAGPPENDVFAGMWAIIHDAAHAQQCAIVIIESYIANSKTVILSALPAFGIAAGDNISIMGPAPLQPTAQKLRSAGRTLDVSTGGEAGVDWANVGSPTTVVTLSGTTVKTATDVETDTQDIQSRLPAALGANGNIKADVRDYNGTAGTFASGRPEVNTTHFGGSAGTFSSGRPEVNASHISGSATAADNVEIVFATDFATNYSTTTDKWQVEANVLQIEGSDATNQIRDSIVDDATRIDASALNTASGAIGSNGSGLTEAGGTGDQFTAIPWNAAWDAEVESECNDALVGQNLDHLVKIAVDTDFPTTVHLNSVIGYLADAGGTATYDRTTDSLEVLGAATAPSAASIADAVWDEALSGHLSAGSTGEALNAAGAAGDPWVTALPGAYGAGSAGFIVGTNLDALISSRLAPTTSGRTLDVTATGEAGIDWANIGGATTTVNLSGTTVKTATDIETDTQDIQSRLPAALTSDGNIKADSLRISGSATAADNLEIVFDTDFATNYSTTFDAWVVRVSSGTGTGQISLSSGLLTWNTAWDAEVQSEVEDGLNNLGYTTTVSGRIDAAISSRLASASYTAPLTAAQTQTECEEALQTYHLDHLIASADPGSVVADSSFLAKLTSKSATPAFSSYSNTTDSLEALRDRGDAAWTTATGFSTHSASDVWAVGTRTLTAGTNIVLAKGVGVTGFNDLSAAQVNAEADTALSDVGLTTTITGRIDVAVSTRLASSSYTAPLDAAGVRSAIGLASANLDTQLDALPTAAENAAALLDLSNGIETGVTPRQAIRAIAAILAGIISGAGTGTEVFKAIAAASGGTTRVTVSVDSNGNRSAITLNL